MAALNKFNQFAEDLASGVHDFNGASPNNAFTVALTATANAPVATNSVLTDLTQIAYTYLSSRLITITSGAQASGTFKVVFQDLTISASGGTAAAFQYIVIYNDTPTTPTDPLIGWYDYGSALTLADGESLTINFDDTNGFFQLS